MGKLTTGSNRSLPDGTPLHNRLLAALPVADYDRLLKHLRMKTVAVGDTLQAHGTRITDVYFPNGGVFSVTNQMQDGALIEVATVGNEGMLGIGVFFGDRSGVGRTFQQVPNGLLPIASRGAVRERDRGTGAVPRRGWLVCAGEPAANHAVHGVQCSARCDETLLPVAASDARPRGGRRVSPQAGVSLGHARRPSSHRHRRIEGAAATGLDLEPVWAHSSSQTRSPRGRVVRVLRSHPGELRAARPLKRWRGLRHRSQVAGHRGTTSAPQASLPEPRDQHSRQVVPDTRRRA